MYLVYKKIHAAEKAVIVMGDGLSFFQTRGLKNLQDLWFLNLRVLAAHDACMGKVKRTE